jgi:formylglycine-generating enzyme required for sulfatase activity
VAEAVVRRRILPLLGALLAVLDQTASAPLRGAEASAPPTRAQDPSFRREFARIPGGWFRMGDASGEGEPWERPRHRVRVRTFHIGRTEVTFGQWSEVLVWALARGYSFSVSMPGSAPGASYPVGDVSWYDAIKWANARSERDGRKPVYYADPAHRTVYRAGDLNAIHVAWHANGYRLPTEAEWEKAARGGRDGHHFPWPSAGASHANHLRPDLANYRIEDASGIARGVAGVRPVGSYAAGSPGGGDAGAQGCGLHDIAGNLWEWCWDRWAPDTYTVAPRRDPRGPDAGPYRVMRGGSWGTVARLCRVAARGVAGPEYRCDCTGFRLVVGGSR